MIALTRQPSPALSRCALTFVERQAIDPDRALAQHRGYCEALRSCGAEVITLPAASDLPDSVFVEDAALILDELAVLMSPGIESRRAEVDRIEAEIARLRPVARISPPATIEGGDILKVGKSLYVGLSPRTNAAGGEALKNLVAPYGYEVIPVAVRDCLHLKTACTALDDRTLLANPTWVDLRPFAGFRIVTVCDDEPWAANALRVNDTLLVNAAFPRTADKVAGLISDVRRVEILEFLKAEAGLTCLSLIFEQAG